MIVPCAEQPPAAVADHYDELDAVYRDVWGEHVHHGLWRTRRESVAEATDALSDLVAAELASTAGDRLVDIGCGYGATAARFAEQLGVEVTGFTLSREQAAVARARPQRLTIHVRDWLANGMEDGAFDGGYAIESTEHMADKPRVFAEAARTIRPGGRLVVCAWLAADRPTRAAVRHLLEPICREGRLHGMGTRGEYQAMAEAAGLRLTRYQDVSRQVRRTWTIVLRRLVVQSVRSAGFRRLLLSGSTRNRVFALSVPRLILAYRTGAMRYGVFTFTRLP